MKNYNRQVEIRWSDLDPNFHVRHSVYYDFGAFVRMGFLTENGLSAAVLLQYQLGPILFREECQFKKEIHFGDDVSIDLVLKRASPNYSRWTFQHHIYKNKETLAAIITVDGAWLDTNRRRLTIPTEVVRPSFELLPKSDDFILIERNK